MISFKFIAARIFSDWWTFSEGDCRSKDLLFPNRRTFSWLQWGLLKCSQPQIGRLSLSVAVRSILSAAWLINLLPWKQMIWIPGMSRPACLTASKTFFSASSPWSLLESPLNLNSSGTKATGEVGDSCLSKKDLTNSAEGSSGEETADIYTGILL